MNSERTKLQLSTAGLRWLIETVMQCGCAIIRARVGRDDGTEMSELRDLGFKGE